MRKDFGSDGPFPEGNFAELLKAAEVARFSLYVFTCLSKDPATYPAATQRSDLIREMRSLKGKLDGQDKKYLPAPLFEAVSKKLWAPVRK